MNSQTKLIKDCSWILLLKMKDLLTSYPWILQINKLETCLQNWLRWIFSHIISLNVFWIVDFILINLTKSQKCTRSFWISWFYFSWAIQKEKHPRFSVVFLTDGVSFKFILFEINISTQILSMTFKISITYHWIVHFRR